MKDEMIAISDKETERVRQWGRNREGEILLRYATAGHALDEAFTGFVDRVARLVPAIKPKKDNDVDVALPSLFIGEQLTYQALLYNVNWTPF